MSNQIQFSGVQNRGGFKCGCCLIGRGKPEELRKRGRYFCKASYGFLSSGFILKEPAVHELKHKCLISLCQLLVTNRNFFLTGLGARSSKSRCQCGWGSGALLGCRLLIVPSPSMEGGLRGFSGVFCKSVNRIYEGPTSLPKHLPKTLPVHHTGH